MLEVGRFRESWSFIRAGQPGERFARFYHRQHTRGPGGSIIPQLALAFLLLGIGLVLLFIPGPGIPFLLVGAALLAERSLTTARLLDRLEIRMRRVLRR